MFLTESIPFLIAKATLRVDRDDQGERTRVADLSLVVEPFSHELASEMEMALADHLFDAGTKEIRQELEDVTLNPRAARQRIIVRSAPDAPALATLKDCRILDLAVKTMRSEKTGTVWLKATLGVRIDLGERAVREFLFHHFGELRCFSFYAEQLELPTVAERVAAAVERVKNPSDGVRLVAATMTENGRETGTKFNADGSTETIDRPARETRH